jgi:hypothetical protein
LCNGINFSLKNRGIFTQREAEAPVWSDAINTCTCPWVSLGTVRKPDQCILRELRVFYSYMWLLDCSSLFIPLNNCLYS